MTQAPTPSQLEQDARWRAAATRMGVGAPPRKVAPAVPIRLPPVDPAALPANYIPAFLPMREYRPIADDVPQWKRIAIEVARKHRIALNELLSARRAVPLVRARQEAMYRMKFETNMSFPMIGRRLGGRDHTTVLHGIRRHVARLEVVEALGVEALRK